MASARPAKFLSDRFENARPGEPVDLWIYSAFPKDNWVTRQPGDQLHAEHPGTAIRLRDRLYEVMKVEEAAEAGYAVRYGLKSWNPHHTARQVISYTLQTQDQAATDYLEEVRKRCLRARIQWLFPLAGLAPDPLLRDWGKKTALNMVWVSAGSALMGLAGAFTLCQILGSAWGSCRHRSRWTARSLRKTGAA